MVPGLYCGLSTQSHTRLAHYLGYLYNYHLHLLKIWHHSRILCLKSEIGVSVEDSTGEVNLGSGLNVEAEGRIWNSG